MAPWCQGCRHASGAAVPLNLAGSVANGGCHSSVPGSTVGRNGYPERPGALVSCPVPGPGLYRASPAQQPQLGDTAAQWPAPPQRQQEPALLSLVPARLGTTWHSTAWPLLVALHTHAGASTHTHMCKHTLPASAPPHSRPQHWVHAPQGGHSLAPQRCRACQGSAPVLPRVPTANSARLAVLTGKQAGRSGSWPWAKPPVCAGGGWQGEPAVPSAEVSAPPAPQNPAWSRCTALKAPTSRPSDPGGDVPPAQP